jgi:hypothetical protein
MGGSIATTVEARRGRNIAIAVQVVICSFFFLKSFVNSLKDRHCEYALFLFSSFNNGELAMIAAVLFTNCSFAEMKCAGFDPFSPDRSVPSALAYQVFNDGI